MFRTTENLFTSCTDPNSLCERPEALLGSGVGVCNVTSQLCECPSGYDGKDMFTTWNDCHISITSKHIVEYMATGFLTMCALASFLGIFRLLIHWGIIYWVNDEIDEFQTVPRIEPQNSSPTMGIIVSTETIPLTSEPTSPQIVSPPKRRPTLQSFMPSVDLGELQAPRPNARTHTFQQMVIERKRRRNTLVLIVIWFLFSIFGLIFQIHRHLGYTFRQRLPLMLFSLAMTMSTVLWGLWMVTYTWFSNFPSLKTFAGMFPAVKGNILIKHPGFLKAFMLLNDTAITTCAFTFVLIIPLADEPSVGRTLYQTLISILGGGIVVFCLTHSAACLVLLRLFWVLRASSTDSKSGDRNNKIGKGERTVLAVFGLTLLAGPFFTAWTFFMAFHPVGIRYSFFFLSALLVGGASAGLVSTYVFVFRMGSRYRVRKGSSSHSPNINSKKSFKRGSLDDKALTPLQE
jgi:hypothetical protein